ncbi:hypothetical protein B0H17DRAFT_1028454 [Mycena rosella]|uniref:Uncharacterized protein n=1 Tax=Mycena rosella TaxID=1033263 RepID=A0AAD7H0N5_MYCRO|nr:hypothetical protein B0H17DRAFT_1028454 [Mycena rosella]
MDTLSQPLSIHERIAVYPQSASPLYNGRIPPEIRNVLFEYILAEYTKTDAASVYPQWLCRPGYTGARAINVAFLLTCRRVYLETYHLPAASKGHVFWHAPTTGPFGAQFPDIHGFAHEQDYFARFQPWQLALVKEVHLFTQMYWLEQSFPELCESNVLPDGLERLRITLRAGDWWWCEQNYPFFLNPHRDGYLEEMNEDIAQEERGQTVEWEEGRWGAAFQGLQALRELEIEFETTMDRREEMRKIVNRALTWRFPMGERGVLSTQGLAMEFSQWQGEENLHCVFAAKWKLVEDSTILGQ